MIDFVFPNSNEKEFSEIAKELGFDKLCFVYPFSSFPKNAEYIPNTTRAVFCKASELPKARKLAKFVIVDSSDADRNVIEKQQFDIITNLEGIARSDSTHFRRSGLNQVLCTLLNKRKKTVAFNLNALLRANKGLRVIILGRFAQNVMLCRKYKVKILLASFARTLYEMRAAHDMVAFGITIGMHPSDAKLSLNANL